MSRGAATATATAAGGVGGEIVTYFDEPFRQRRERRQWDRQRHRDRDRRRRRDRDRHRDGRRRRNGNLYAPGINGVAGTSSATASATTTGGAKAQSLATATDSPASAQSTAETSLGRVSLAQTVASASTASKATTNAIAQGGDGQMLVNPGQSAYAFATALPSKSYSTALIGGASMVADALLGPGEAVFGTSVLGANLSGDGSAADTYSASSTFDFAYRGDLVLGLIAPLDGAPTDFQKIDFTVTLDGTEVVTKSFTSLATADTFLQMTRSTLARLRRRRPRVLV